ncbi:MULTISPECIES: alkaline phosphatase D family protein [unclassified Pseudoalteromonas]|uniref:alkaline phosphatase D family protein n=1 Tax=unclassified Pseudoalteromonas TaxID=194690 RepID=UPI0015CA758F|nr:MULTISPECIES: alkaline phosphatase D family protein [unclassified Pseudoalteromonas]MBB1371459.1 alkaline phosphatase family protein [Pseudoalteromonas sp. SR45-4]NYR13555.1 alkaline phosphatase family protein [Pseudoalteromonas sp. MIP2626]
MKIITAVVLTNLLVSFSALSAPSKILFGSCGHQDKNIPIFDAINKEQSDLFIFLGDNIYGDTNNMSVLANKYQRLGAKPGFKTLKAQTPIIAMWDDHDYGQNDAGKEYPHKEESRQIMLDFWQEPANSPRRTRPDGIYTSYTYGEGEQTVQVIMPDLRWNRDALNAVSKLEYDTKRKLNNQGPYSPSHVKGASMLGEAQWQWLEQELKKPAAIKLIASSLQLLPEFTGWESWANFPDDRKRLFTLIKKHKVNGVVIISGDTHWGEISQYKHNLDYPLIEMTSSGLTEKWKNVSPNTHRIGDFTHQVNYGDLSIDWQQADPSISLQLKDIDGKAIMQSQFKLSSISPY